MTDQDTRECRERRERELIEQLREVWALIPTPRACPCCGSDDQDAEFDISEDTIDRSCEDCGAQWTEHLVTIGATITHDPRNEETPEEETPE